MGKKAPFWRRQRPTTKLKRKISKATGINFVIFIFFHLKHTFFEKGIAILLDLW